MAELIFTSDGRKYLAIILVLAALGIWVFLPLAHSVLDEMPLPLTRHAQEAHAAQKWNAANIQQHMLDRKCTPTEYICADSDQEIVYCKAEQGIPAIGLIIGRTVRQIITGLAGPENWWQNRCR